MPIQVTIDDSLVKDFSADAKNTIIDELNMYARKIIAEARLVEEGGRTRNAKTEITSNNVLHAVNTPKQTENAKKRNGIIALKITSSIFLLITGFLFSPERFSTYPFTLYLFILALIVCCITTAILYVKEG